MTVKEQLHQLVDQLPDADAEEALDYLLWLLAEEDTLTDEELALVELGEAEIARGHYVRLEDLKRDLAG